jgi:hypothetical protein
MSNSLDSSPVPYQGRADHVWPPYTYGWAEVPYEHDAGAVERARLMLGSLPPYHYQDAALPSGLYRFFAFETPVGVAVSALKFVGESAAGALMMGDPPDQADYIEAASNEGGIVQFDGGAVPEDNSAITGGGTGSMGVKITPVAYATLQIAASMMNDALSRHGFIRLDQPIYAGFQLKAGDLVVDAFPGENTMTRLSAVLAGMGITMANVTIYPWKATTPGGLTGVDAYDGTNAPTWAQWTGKGAPPPPAVTVAKAGVSSGGIIAAIATLAVVAGGVIAKASGKI